MWEKNARFFFSVRVSTRWKRKVEPKKRALLLLLLLLSPCKEVHCRSRKVPDVYLSVGRQGISAFLIFRSSDAFSFASSWFASIHRYCGRPLPLIWREGNKSGDSFPTLDSLWKEEMCVLLTSIRAKRVPGGLPAQQLPLQSDLFFPLLFWLLHFGQDMASFRQKVLSC